jgi:menaquinone-dependent protoporphyrinogen oxidase
MKVLVFFATVEGQTDKIAHFVEKELRKADHAVEMVDANDLTAQVTLDGIDKVILAASVHERRHPKSFEVFLAASQRELEALDTLLISVSLNAAFEEGLEEAKEYVTELKMRTGFTPTMEALVAGAVRTDSYDYFASQIVRHVVLRDKDFDASQGEHEFTDWQALAVTVSGFVNGSELESPG